MELEVRVAEVTQSRKEKPTVTQLYDQPPNSSLEIRVEVFLRVLVMSI
jgi:hypothetical protein